MDDAASAACETDFAGDRKAISEEMRRRAEAIAPLNISNIDINDALLDQDERLDAALVRARATKLLTEGDGELIHTREGPLAPFATSLLLKFSSEAVHELLEQQRDAVARSCGGQITKDLALGTLLGDILGIEMLAEEACKVGKAAATQLNGSIL